MPLCTPPNGKNFCTRGEHFTMSNGVFNLNLLALVFSEILGGPKFTLGGHTPPARPLAENFFLHKASTSQHLIVFNFNILALVVSEILGGPKFKLGGPVPPVRHLAEIFLYPRRVGYYI